MDSPVNKDLNTKTAEWRILVPLRKVMIIIVTID